MHQRKAQSRHFQTFVKQSFMRVKIKRGDMEPDLKGSWGAPVEHQGHRPDSCRWENAAHATKDALHVSFHCCDKVPEIMNSRTRKDSCCLTVSEASVHCHLAWLPRACRKARRGDHTWPMGVEQRKEQGPKVPFKDTPLWQHLFPVALDTSLPKSPTGCWASLSHTGPWGYSTSKLQHIVNKTWTKGFYDTLENTIYSHLENSRNDHFREQMLQLSVVCLISRIAFGHALQSVLIFCFTDYR